MGQCLSSSPPRELETGVEYFFTCGRGDDATWRLDDPVGSSDLVVVLAADGTLGAENTGVYYEIVLQWPNSIENSCSRS